MVFSNSNQVKAMNLTLNINFNNENEDDISKIFAAQRVVSDSKIPAVKFLGVFFDPQLNFNFHVKSITSKLSKALYMLRSTKKFPSTKSQKSCLLYSPSLPFNLLFTHMELHFFFKFKRYVHFAKKGSSYCCFRKL